MTSDYPEPDCDDYELPSCPICGNEMEWVDCWSCQGEGGYHDCGDDCCPCLEPELDLNVDCPECKGEGGYLECQALPHSEEQMAAFRARQGVIE